MFKILWSKIKNYVILGAILVVSIFLIYYSFSGSSDKIQQEVLDKYLEQYKIEYQNNMAIKEKEIQDKDRQLIELSTKLANSQMAYNLTKDELDKLKREASSINEPKDLQEIKDRLRAMGYNIK